MANALCWLTVFVTASVSSAQVPTCGTKGPDSTPWTPSARIVGGQTTTACEWPWQVSLRDGSFHFCGGTLIAKRWVLTAAHCMGGSMTVTVGDHGVTGNSDTFQKTYEVAYTISHPDYDDNTMEYDFALVKLAEDVELNECVGLACMPTEDVAEGTTCWITGWGTLASDGPSPENLVEGMVTILSSAKCNKRNSYNGEVTDSMICAKGVQTDGTGYVDACQGDSGGPLVCEVDGSWTLMGATSWGYGCGSKKYPGIWSRVPMVRDWVEAMMQPVKLPKGTMWKLGSGPCEVVDNGACIQSPNYPAAYPNGQKCLINVDEDQSEPISTVGLFKTEADYDILQVSGVEYSGSSGPQSVTPTNPITWSPDSAVRKAPGWKICKNSAAPAATTTAAPVTCEGIPGGWTSSLCTRKCNQPSKCNKNCQKKCTGCVCNSRRLKTGPRRLTETEKAGMDMDTAVLV